MKNLVKKALLVVLALIGYYTADAQTIVHQQISQGRLIEPNMHVFVKPQIVDLNVSKERINKTYFFTNAEVEAHKKEPDNLTKTTLFRAMKDTNSDMIVAAIFNIYSAIVDGVSGFNVEIMGYPAVYTNWRTMTSANDTEWIRVLLNAQNTKQTDAINAINR